jgi:CBS domain-containing protein
VILRTKAGEYFFYSAVENGIINTWVMEKEPIVIERVIVAAMQKRENALREAKELEEVYGYLPVLLLRETDALAKTKVEEIMTKNIQTIPYNTTVSKFLDLVAVYHHVSYPVINENSEPIGWVTLEEAAKVEKSKRDETLVDQIARRKLVTAYPEETALDTFKKMQKFEIGRVLVLDRADPKKILGIVTKTDLMHTLTKQY